MDLATTAAQEQGNAMDKNAIHMEEAETKMTKFTTSVTIMWQNMMSPEGMKVFWGTLADLVQVLGNLPTIITVVSAAILFFSGTAITAGIISVSSYIATLVALIATEGLLAVATMELSLVFGKLKLIFLSNPLGWIALAIGAAVVAFQLFNSTVEDTNKILEDNSKKLRESNDAYNEDAQNIKT